MSSTAGTNSSQLAYSQGVGTSSTNAVFVSTRSPTSNDVTFKVGTIWLSTSTDTMWVLNSFTSSAGQITANWYNFAGVDSLGVDTTSGTGTNPTFPNTSGYITLTGAQVATGTVGTNVIRTDATDASTITIEIQRSTDAAAPDVTLNGVCHFDSSMFSVDSNAFVTLAGGGIAVDSFAVSTGTSPVVPDSAGLVTLTDGNGVAMTGGTNAITFDMKSPFTGDFTFTDSTAGNTQSITVSNTDNTAANASSASIAINVGGTTQIGDPYISLGTGTARSYAVGSDTNDGQSFKITTAASSAITPSSGTSVLAYEPSFNAWAMGITPLDDTAALTIVRDQTTQGGGIACNNLDNTTATSHCVVGITTGGASGGDPFVSLSVTGSADSYSLGIDNSDSDIFKLTNIFTGPSTGDTLFSATNAGVISFPQYSANNIPYFGASGLVSELTLTDGQLVVGATAGAPVAANITAGTGINITNAANSITISATGSGDVSQVVIQTFTANGTYTPTSGMLYCVIEVQGAGGGGGGGEAGGGVGGCGAAGGYSKGAYSAATIGASQGVTIGAGGPGGLGNAAGTTGGTTSVGALLSATGGTGGTAGAAGTTTAVGVAGGTGSSGILNLPGQNSMSIGLSNGAVSLIGKGADSLFGAGGICPSASASNGNNATGYGAGASGAWSAGGAVTGGTGSDGIVVITEYVA